MIRKQKQFYWITFFSISVLILSLGSTPRVAQARSTDALMGCLLFAPLFGPAGLIYAAGCGLGHAVSGAAADGSFPRFDFPNKNGLPSNPLSGDIVYYTAGKRETLSVGLWLGCPPECMTGTTMIKGRQDVKHVIFYIVSSDDLKAAATFDKANWTQLGHGVFNNERNTWELPWNTTQYTAPNGYLIRADFLRQDGKKQIGVGLAAQEWMAKN